MTAPAQGWRLARGRAIAMFASLGAVFLAAQVYRYGLALVAPELARELALSPTALAGVTSSMFMTFALMQIPVGMLVDRFGPRVVIGGLQAFSVAGALLVASAESGAALTLAAVLMGMGSSGNLIGSLVVLSRWFPADRFATLTGALIAMGGVGHLISTAPLAYLVEAVGWRGAYYGLAGAIALAALAAVLVVRNRPPWDGGREGPPESLRASVAGVRTVLGARALYPILVMTALGTSTLFTLRGLWAGPYLNDIHGLDPGARGWVLLVMAAAIIVGNLIYGPLDRAFDTRKRIVLAGAALMVATLSSLALAPGPALWQATLLLGLLALFSTYDTVLIAHGRALFPHRLAGRGITMVNLALFSGVAGLQFASGLVLGAFPSEDGAAPEAAYRTLFGFLAVAGVIGLLVYRRARDIRPSQGFPA